ncbi:hypothetical protein EZS27_009684 [termite gut metagenome]|uniref:Uncharacterized protein n=1 Tax=termite gut metagenome TaxID=433724 RepID=A0A5J4S8U8_9ZZZZ
MQDNRPCVLQGGRGTGKTTVLRGLSYQGLYALHKKSIVDFDQEKYIGIYFRADTNHVRTFIGGGLNDEIWKNIFAHYFNLIISWEILQFIDWHRKESLSDDILSPYNCKLIGKALLIENNCDNFDLLIESVESAMYDFQSTINDIAKDSKRHKSTLLGYPISIITERAIELSQFKDKMFSILIDEYENLENYQQQSLNSFLKHSTDFYTVKIGVGELGWRVKYTFNNEELLNDPADYVLINIEKEFAESTHFNEFAKNVCQQRIKDLIPDSEEYSIDSVLPSLKMEAEALLLDIKHNSLLNKLNDIPQAYRDKIEHLSDLYKFFIIYWAKTHDTNIINTIQDYANNTRSWDTRYDNYKYDMLFKIRKGRGMGGIQKYYAGWDTFIKLANGNIRYLMELVYRSYEKHLMDDKNILAPIDYRLQTLATQEVGKKNLQELEGLWKNGAQLTKLLLGFGRIFNVLVTSDSKVAPEINQFVIKGTIPEQTNEILSAAVMNLAFIRIQGNKLDDSTSTRDYMYSIHPIFAPYFVFGYRKKRKMEISEYEFTNLINNPKEAIKEILSKKNIQINEINEIPEQLSLFEFYYD